MTIRDKRNILKFLLALEFLLVAIASGAAVGDLQPAHRYGPSEFFILLSTLGIFSFTAWAIGFTEKFERLETAEKVDAVAEKMRSESQKRRIATSKPKGKAKK